MTLYGIRSKLLTWFGDIKYSKFPPQLYYCPVTFKISGEQTRSICKLLLPGDLVLRGYNCYVDSLFIPGKYSYTGIYVGDGKVIHATAEGVNACDVIDFFRCDRCCVLRPNQGSGAAIIKAWGYIKSNTPYDFKFEQLPIQDNRLYCHELGAACYPSLNVKRLTPKWCWGLIKGKPAFLAESFITNPNFAKVYESR